jgi:hypothetical protein
LVQTHLPQNRLRRRCRAARFGALCEPPMQGEMQQEREEGRRSGSNRARRLRR